MFATAQWPEISLFRWEMTPHHVVDNFPLSPLTSIVNVSQLILTLGAAITLQLML